MNALIGMRLWMASQPLALRPAWAAAAGALAVAPAPLERDTVVAVLLVMALVDPLWGAAASRLAGLGGWPHVPADASGPSLLASLPWVQPGSPASRLARWLDGAAAQAWRDGLVALACSSLLAALMGGWAVGMTLLVGVLASLLRGADPTAVPYRLVDGALTVALPMLAGARAVGEWDARLVGLAVLFALLAASGRPSPWRVGLPVVSLALVAALVAFRLPLAAALVSLLLLPATLWAIQPVARARDGLALARWRLLSGPWWLLALWVAGGALR